MNIELTTQQQRQIDIFHGQPPQFVDPRTQTTYVLIRVEEYELLQEILAEEKVQRAIHRVALRNAVAHMDADCELLQRV